MQDLASWVAAIREDAEDVPRLACADWLEERGQAERAELIRVQCALARMEGDDPRRPELARREDELLALHEAGWLAQEVPAWARKGAEFRRGFVEHVAAGAATLAARAGALFARLPVTSVRVSRAHAEDVERLAASARLVGLRHLHLYDFHAESLGPLLSAPLLPQLRGLGLSGWSRSVDVDDMAGLLEPPSPARLARLELDSFRLDVPGIGRLARSEAAGRLESLRLEVLDNADVRALTAGDHFTSLRTLDLGGNVLLTDEAARRVAGAALCARLTRLSLRGLFSLTDASARALAAAPFPRLTDLDISGTRITAAGVRALVGSANLPRLSRLELGGDRADDRVGHRPVWRPARPASQGLSTLWVRDVRG